jgi:hypothetical protein
MFEASWTGVKFYGDAMPETIFLEAMTVAAMNGNWGQEERR